MSRDLFWRAVAEYSEASHDGWLSLMRFIDGRNEYSLAIFAWELEEVTDDLRQRYVSAVAPDERLSQNELEVAVENACLLGKAVFDGVMTSPDLLSRYVDGALGGVFAEEWAAYWEES